MLSHPETSGLAVPPPPPEPWSSPNSRAHASLPPPMQSKYADLPKDDTDADRPPPPPASTAPPTASNGAAPAPTPAATAQHTTPHPPVPQLPPPQEPMQVQGPPSTAHVPTPAHGPQSQPQPHAYPPTPAEAEEAAGAHLPSPHTAPPSQGHTPSAARRPSELEVRKPDAPTFRASFAPRVTRQLELDFGAGGGAQPAPSEHGGSSRGSAAVPTTGGPEPLSHHARRPTAVPRNHLSNPQYPNTGIVEHDEDVPPTDVMARSKEYFVALAHPRETVGLLCLVRESPIIEQIEAGTPAERSGLTPGGYIIAVDDQLVMTGEDVRNACLAALKTAPCTMRVRVSLDNPARDRAFLSQYAAHRTRVLGSEAKPTMPGGPVLVPTMVYFEPSHDAKARTLMDAAWATAEADSVAGVPMPTLPKEEQFWENLDMQAGLCVQARRGSLVTITSPTTNARLELNSLWLRAFVYAYNQRFPREVTMHTVNHMERFLASDAFCMFAEQRLLTDAAGELDVKFCDEEWLYPSVEGWNRMVYEWAVTSKTTEAYRKFHIQSRNEERARAASGAPPPPPPPPPPVHEAAVVDEIVREALPLYLPSLPALEVPHGGYSGGGHPPPHRPPTSPRLAEVLRSPQHARAVAGSMRRGPPTAAPLAERILGSPPLPGRRASPCRDRGAPGHYLAPRGRGGAVPHVPAGGAGQVYGYVPHAPPPGAAGGDAFDMARLLDEI